MPKVVEEWRLDDEIRLVLWVLTSEGRAHDQVSTSLVRLARRIGETTQHEHSNV